ncbi:C-type lectin domain family 12 member B-like [Centropristis striata]|uniref:C-type lectin domain family 12 member B-like n=1 Tax=Centropristis striata TaxID=184440 RepID=UPI0027E1EC53|nr:C-type lectin domain family 12 member B-like [Centropristis striata]
MASVIFPIVLFKPEHTTSTAANVRGSSNKVSHPAPAHLISELEYLRSNYSDLIKAAEEANETLQRAIEHPANVRGSSNKVSHPAPTHLISELEYLRSNYSDLIKAAEEANETLQRAIEHRAELKVQIEQQKTINDNYQRQTEALRTEKTNLKLNVSSYEGSCGKCPSGWLFLNSSCYYFSYIESSSATKSFNDSREDCISRGADLTMIDSPEEQNAIIKQIKADGSRVGNGETWIGLHHFPGENTWKWVDGRALVGG